MSVPEPRRNRKGGLDGSSGGWKHLLAVFANISDSVWKINYSQQFFSSTSGSKLLLNVPEGRGNQRWPVAVPLNRRAFIHRSWQLFPFGRSALARRSGHICVAGQRWGGVSINHGAARAPCMIQLLPPQQQRSSAIIQCPSS